MSVYLTVTDTPERLDAVARVARAVGCEVERFGDRIEVRGRTSVVLALAVEMEDPGAADA